MYNKFEKLHQIGELHERYLELRKELEDMEKTAVYSEENKPKISSECITGEFLRKDENGGKPVPYFNVIGFKNKDGRDELGAGGFTVGKNKKYLSQNDFDKIHKKAKLVFAVLKEANKVPGGTVIFYEPR